MKLFGCAIFPLLRPYSKHKFVFRSTPCVFLSPSSNHSAFHCLDSSTGHIYLACHAKFIESIFPYISSDQESIPTDPSSWLHVTSNLSHWDSGDPSGMSYNPNSNSGMSSLSPLSPLTTSPPPSVSYTTPLPSNSLTTPIPLSSSNHNSNTILSSLSSSPPTKSKLFVDIYNKPDPPPPDNSQRTHSMTLRSSTITKRQALLTHRTVINYLTQEPNTYNQAKSHAEWRDAMSRKIDALMTNNIWTLVPRPLGKNIVGNKWLFRIKRKADGSVERYKARLVAKGYTQEPSVDYSETFSPVIKYTTIQTLLSLATTSGWCIRQLDISNAFLHGTLQDEIYMEQPMGFVNSNLPHHVCACEGSVVRGLGSSRLAASFIVQMISSVTPPLPNMRAEGLHHHIRNHE